MADHTPTPWAYRPLKHDDWGWIRDADGSLAATARDGRVMSERFDEFRAAKKDPYAANGAFIVKAVNNHEALTAVRRTFLRYLQAENCCKRSGTACSEKCACELELQGLVQAWTGTDVGGAPK